MTLPTVEDPDGRRHLADAILAVGSDLSLPVTLRRIVESAVTLVGARYGALGVLDESGRGMAEFVHVGLQPGQVEQIDHLPARVRDIVLIQDRERIAADLHDTVIQRLYATGLGLEASVPLAPPELAERLARAIADPDDTIRQIRATIFALQAPSAHQGLRAQILNLAGEAAGSLGFQPRLHLDGPIDHAVPDDIAAHLMAVLREALSNVARHAHASNVEVTIRARSGLQLVASVTDDGVGMASTSRPGGRGMVNITRRAEELGGDVHVGSAAGQRGTTVTWQVPPAS